MSGILYYCFFASITMQVACKLSWIGKVIEILQVTDVKRIRQLSTCMVMIAACKFDAINAAIITQF